MPARDDVIKDVDSKGGPCIRTVWSMLSVRGCIAGLCLVSILAISLGTGFFLKNTCDDALAKTRRLSEENVNNSLQHSRDSLTETVSDLLFHTAEATEIGVVGYLKQAYMETARVNLVVDTFAATIPRRKDWIHDLKPQAWHIMQTFVDSEGLNSAVRGVAFYDDNSAFVVQIMGGRLMTVVIHEGGANAGNMEVGASLKVTGEIDMTSRYEVFAWGEVLHDSLLNVSGLDPARRLWEPGESLLSTIEHYTPLTTMSIYSLRKDPLGRSGSLRTAVTLTLASISEYMSKLTNSLVNAKSATRIYTCVRSSWIAERMRTRPVFTPHDIDVHDQQGILTGASVGTPGDPVTEDGIFTPQLGTQHRVVMRDVNATDPIIRGVATAIHALAHDRGFASPYDGYTYIESLHTRTTKLTITRPRQPDDFVSPEDDFFKTPIGDDRIAEEHFIIVRRVHDEYGVDWWMTVSLGAQQVMALVERTSQTVTQRTSDEHAEVSNEVSDTRATLWWFVIGVSVFLAVLSVFATHYVLRPILIIQNEMSNVAQMQLDQASEKVIANSPFREVNAMQRHFLMMTANLREYRAYIPDAVLTDDCERSPIRPHRAAAPPTGDIAVVFTDIQGSTKLWTRSASNMNTAIEQHNEIIRGVYREHDGYEVKTIGDAFMLTFQEAVPAVRCALDIQHRFKQASWPERLRLPEAGLVVRIGIHYGSTIAEENPITGRVDYRGSTVNMASRTEAKAKGGTICVTRSVVTAIETSGGFSLISFSAPLFPMGAHELRGLGQGHELFLLVPLYLQHRYGNGCEECSPMSPGRRQVLSDKNSEGDKEMFVEAKKTELFLTRTTGTVAVCKLNTNLISSKVFEDLNLIVRSAAEAAISLDGEVVSVSSAEVILTWNASKKCKQHVTSALRFAEYLETRTESIMRLGIATGDFIHGNVGTTKQRYTTSLGLPLVVAEAAAEYAADTEFYSMYADATYEGNALVRHEALHVSRALLLCDVWYYRKTATRIKLHHLCTVILQSVICHWDADLPHRVNILTHDVEEREASVKLLKAVLSDVSLYETNLSLIKELAKDCQLAAHHHAVLAQAKEADLQSGYLIEVDLLRSPLHSGEFIEPANPSI